MTALVLTVVTAIALPAFQDNEETLALAALRAATQAHAGTVNGSILLAGIQSASAPGVVTLTPVLYYNSLRVNASANPAYRADVLQAMQASLRPGAGPDLGSGCAQGASRRFCLG